MTDEELQKKLARIQRKVFYSDLKKIGWTKEQIKKLLKEVGYEKD